MTTEFDSIAQQAPAPINIGQILRLQRLSLDVEERQIATELKLSIDHVYALEENRFDRFRSATFARGYIKSYCRVLNLDHKPILDAFDDQQSVKESHIRPIDSLKPQSSSGKDPIFLIVSTVIIAIIVFVAFWWPSYSTSPDVAVTPDIENASPVVEEPVIKIESEQNVEVNTDSPVLSSADAEVQPASAVPSTALPTESNGGVVTGLSAETIALLEDAGVDTQKVVEATKEVEKSLQVNDNQAPAQNPEVVAPAVTSQDIFMRFSSDCWTEVRDSSGRILFSGVKKSGSTLELTGKAPYRVTLGFSKGVSELLYKGQVFDFSSFVRKDLARFELQ